MNEHLPRKSTDFWSGRWSSFCAAITGAAYVLRTQTNAQIEVALATIACVIGWSCGLSSTEWAILSLTIGLVLAMEALNTALETVVDLISPGEHPLAKRAKDVAAGAMIFAALGSIAVGIALFGPRLWKVLG